MWSSPSASSHLRHVLLRQLLSGGRRCSGGRWLDIHQRHEESQRTDQLHLHAEFKSRSRSWSHREHDRRTFPRILGAVLQRKSNRSRDMRALLTDCQTIVDPGIQGILHRCQWRLSVPLVHSLGKSDCRSRFQCSSSQLVGRHVLAFNPRASQVSTYSSSTHWRSLLAIDQESWPFIGFRLLKGILERFLGPCWALFETISLHACCRWFHDSLFIDI